MYEIDDSFISDLMNNDILEKLSSLFNGNENEKTKVFIYLFIFIIFNNL